MNSKDLSTCLFSICVDLLRTSHLVYDLGMHQTILSLASNLFLASEFKPTADASKGSDDSNPFVCSSSGMSTLGNHLLHQCIVVITVYQNVLESSVNNTVVRKFSSSPAISPVRKFSQKLEIDKKISGIS